MDTAQDRAEEAGLRCRCWPRWRASGAAVDAGRGREDVSAALLALGGADT